MSRLVAPLYIFDMSRNRCRTNQKFFTKRRFKNSIFKMIFGTIPLNTARCARVADLGIELAPLPGYSPDLMPVEALWRWLREDLTYHHCHATAEDLIRRIAAFEADVNATPCAVADRLWVKDHLDPEEEELRLSS